jgi:hypothetical protein
MDNILLNSGLLWSSPYKKSWKGADSGMFIFNWYNLHNWTTRRVINSDHDDLWSIAFETYDYPRADWWNALSKYYRTKTITITMSLSAPTWDWLNDLIDELKFQTSKTQWYLDIIINWLVRRREATLTWLSFGRQNYNINFLQDVTLTFNCVNPLAFNLTSITNTYPWISGNYATEINYTWKVNCYPTIYLIVKAESDLNSFSIDMNWYVFTVSQSLLPWDFIIIDWETKLVKLNGSVIPYNWPFPVIEPWLNHIEINLNSWALANYDMTFIYKKFFL